MVQYLTTRNVSCKIHIKPCLVVFLLLQLYMLLTFQVIWRTMFRNMIQTAESSDFPKISHYLIPSIRDRRQNINIITQNKSSLQKVAIGMAITSKGCDWSSYTQINNTFPFFSNFLPSFCTTASQGYHYGFILAFDQNDRFYTINENIADFVKLFTHIMESACCQVSNYSLDFVHCSHNSSPARAQNDAMMRAYHDGMEYLYRVNDDSSFKNKGWTESFIHALNSMDPPLVGLVSPWHLGGNMYIMDYEFVHITHINIHGFYYPAELTDWFADEWMTKVYCKDHCQLLFNVTVKHTMKLGQRYKEDLNKKQMLEGLVKTGKAAVLRYIGNLKQ